MEPPVIQRAAEPIACTLTGAEQEQRQREVGTLFRTANAVREHSDGYAFRFPTSDCSLASLADFIAVERHCCPFLTFALTIEPSNGPLWLYLRGSKEIKMFVEGTFVQTVAVPPEATHGAAP